MRGKQQARGANYGCGSGMVVRANAAQAVIGRTMEATTDVYKRGLSELR